MIYHFDTQFQRGITGEMMVVHYLEQQGWTCHTDSVMDGVKRPHDIVAMHPIHSRTPIRIEVKTDWTAEKTRNAFLETVSNTNTRAPGWAYTCKANVLFYLLPESRIAYEVSPARIRRNMPLWIARYPQRAIANAGYKTHGCLVPLHAIQKIAVKTHKL